MYFCLTLSSLSPLSLSLLFLLLLIVFLSDSSIIMTTATTTRRTTRGDTHHHPRRRRRHRKSHHHHSQDDTTVRGAGQVKRKDVFIAYACASYTIWVLISTVAWISHLGYRVPWLQPLIAAKGYPSNRSCPEGKIWEFFKENVPTALVFVLPHSLLTPKRLRTIFGRHGRLLYNGMAAVTLHMFLLTFKPLKSPVLMELPIKKEIHNFTSISMLLCAAYAFCRAPETYDMLGVNSSLSRGGPRAPANMDAITWMGVCAWRKGGVWGFIAFTGLSILPQTLTLGDVLSRGVAATYLRLRSRSFRRWVGSIPGAHHATWILRATLLTLALFTAWRLGEISGRNACVIESLATSLALILTAAEKERDRRQRLANAKKEFLGVEKQKEVEKTTGSRNSSSSSHHHHHRHHHSGNVGVHHRYSHHIAKRVQQQQHRGERVSEGGAPQAAQRTSKPHAAAPASAASE